LVIGQILARESNKVPVGKVQPASVSWACNDNEKKETKAIVNNLFIGLLNVEIQ
jgi:hypothetical protein